MPPPEGGQIATAKFNGASDAPMSCVVGGGDVPTEGAGTIEWKTKDGKSLKSTLSLTISGQMFNSAAVDGSVTDGAFAGARLHGKFRVHLFKEGINCAGQSFFGGLKQAPSTAPSASTAEAVTARVAGGRARPSVTPRCPTSPLGGHVTRPAPHRSVD
ncbi:hypothetical protein [Streptomyces smyrnaeus]|uniref:hypothetical protein n=1 Tax=Streptomyces smyrnaeus TaxID=1387713 RepID=UPI003409D3B9